MDKLILKLYINITGFQKVEDANGCAQMILFDGTAQGEVFNGKILPGGVDTQHYYPDNTMSLSARYIIEGKDFSGQDCKIFIENNACGKNGEELVTKPQIFTDSKTLKYLESSSLYGKITQENNQTVILIFQN